MIVKLVEHDMGITHWVSHKACGLVNSSLPRRNKHVLLTNTPGTEHIC